MRYVSFLLCALTLAITTACTTAKVQDFQNNQYIVEHTETSLRTSEQAQRHLERAAHNKCKNGYLILEKHRSFQKIAKEQWLIECLYVAEPS